MNKKIMNRKIIIKILILIFIIGFIYSSYNLKYKLKYKQELFEIVTPRVNRINNIYINRYISMQKKTADAVIEESDENIAILYYRNKDIEEYIEINKENKLSEYQIKVKNINKVVNDIANLEYAANIFSSLLVDTGIIDKNIKFLFDYTKTTTYKINEEKKIQILFDKNTATIKLLH